MILQVETIGMAELFKFRCYQCQKLIGAPASKFGKVVKCPRCEVELIVPSPDFSESETEPESGSESENPDAFRPEDLGIKLETERLAPPKPVAPASVLEPAGPDPIAFLKQSSVPLDPAPVTRFETPASESLTNDGPEPEVFLEPVPEPLVSKGRGRAFDSRAGSSPRARDVVLPRTAAVAWSLFGILGLGFAFGSGLMIGHFLWK